jgi:hypothetical protein
VTNKFTLKTAIRTALMGSALLAASPMAFADEIPPHERQPFFGDLHIHTNQSLDSYLYNNANNPDDAYKFAKGETTLPIGNSGVTVKISKPLDFAAVTDHAESMVEYFLCVDEQGREVSDVYDSEDCTALRNLDQALFTEINLAMQEEEPKRSKDICPAGEDDAACLNASKTMWQGYQETANEHNNADNFTAFIAYEHSPTFVADGALHRNIIFRGTDVPENVLSAYDVYTPSSLWETLEGTCTGKCEVLVIPHNPNMSKGMFFAKTEPKKGESYTQEDYERRSRLEPLIEIHQAKGNSECLLGAGTTDEFCQFESITRSCDGFDDVPGSDKVNCLEDSYVRNGLKKGLELAGHIKLNGLNPFKYGFIGSTDTHNATSGLTAEFQRVGNTAKTATSEDRLFGDGRLGRSGPVNYNPGGLAGVWAEENSRAAIFDALKRKEAFGTSGSRIIVRFFAGLDYPINLDKYPRETMLQKAYEKGTPMGGDIDDLDMPIDGEIIPYKFLVWAAKDPNSANLQRLQIIKGWEDSNGTHEKVYDVACSDGLEPDSWTHRCPDNGAKVDLKSCNYSENKGATELKTTWIDPDFDPSHRAFYYVRVLENPTCRWSTYDAKELGIEPLNDVAPTVQERAWSSPIWYTPSTTTKEIIKERIVEIIKKKGKKTILQMVKNLLKAKKPFLQALIENRNTGSKKLPNPIIKALLRGKTVTYLNLRDGSTQEVSFTQKGKRVVNLGPDHMVSTPYEIRDDQLYEQSSLDKEYGTSIYSIRSESGYHYIACDSRDNGYCNWEIIRK